MKVVAAEVEEAPSGAERETPAEASDLPVTSRGRLMDYVGLSKPRIAGMVGFAVAAGYVIGARTIEPLVLTLACLGSVIASAGSSMLNMAWEAPLDRRMARTAGRPIPAGRVGRGEAVLLGIVCGAAGIAIVAWGAGALTAGLVLATLLSYVLAYTPLKTRTSLSTLVGAVPGALPPLIGWAAARQTTGDGGWLLFAILFLWQIPHFLAIAYIYREDYRAAGMPVLTVLDGTGQATARQMILYSAALLLVSLTPTLTGLTGPTYFAGALLLGLWFLATVSRFVWAPGPGRARTVFVVSLIYVPLLYALMALDTV